MKLPKKRYLIVGIVILLIILREVGTLDISWYRNNITGNTTSNWQSTATITKPSMKINSVWEETINSPCNFNGQASNIPVRVYYKGRTVMGADVKCQALDVEINSLSPGMIWTPLIKSANFRASATCYGTITLTRNENGNLVATSYNLSGNINVTGSIQIYGTCSYRNAKQMVKDYVVQQVYNNAANYIHKQ